ncbi:MAG TPA: hypothetical protein VMH61_05995 [Candidatus Acidoferrales bacterium]|nr:hypothetical protein [Candidatus Acidoferrales bacterium]
MSSPERAARCRHWLEEQLEQLGNLRNANPRDPSFKLWRQNTLTVLQRIWTGETQRSERFRRIPFSPPSPRADGKAIRDWFGRGCSEAVDYLQGLIGEIDASGVPAEGAADASNAPAAGASAEDDFPVLDLPTTGSAPQHGGARQTTEESEELLLGASASTAPVPEPDAAQPPSLIIDLRSSRLRRASNAPVVGTPAPPASSAPVARESAAGLPPVSSAPVAQESAASLPPASSAPVARQSAAGLPPASSAPVARESAASLPPASSAPVARESAASLPPASAPTAPREGEEPVRHASSRPKPGAPREHAAPRESAAPRKTARSPRPRRAPSRMKLKDMLGLHELERSTAPPPADVAPVPAPRAELPAPAPADVAPVPAPRAEPPAPAAADVAPVPAPRAELPASPSIVPPPPPAPATPEEQVYDDSESLARATADFLRNSPVLGLQGRPVLRAGDGTRFEDPDAIAVATLATDVGRLGVSEAARSTVRDALITLAGQVEAGAVRWETLRLAVALAMEHPELARRFVPILLPWLERAA